MINGTDGMTPRRTAVIGAGIVGLASAAALRRDGHDVTVIDRLPPGEACSFGNSGGMPRSHAFPMATPGILWKVPGYLADPLGPLALRWRHLPRLAPWLWHFVRAGAPERFARNLDLLMALMRESYEAWDALLSETGLRHLVRDDGALTIYRTAAARDEAWPLWQMLIDRGARIERIDAGQLRQLEPMVPDGYACAISEPDYRRTIDPYRLSLGLADHFLRMGGTIRRETVSEIGVGAGNTAALRTNFRTDTFDLLVLATGAWSNPFTVSLGHRVPLEAARGYHVTLLDPGFMPRHAIFVSDMRLSLTPMEMGLRVGGNIEFAGLDSPPDFRRPARQLENVRRLYPNVRTENHTKWAGERPMMPDSLPVIGRSPGHRNVIYAFGHGQYGLALAAITGRLVADLAAERQPRLDLAPFRCDRF
jgi:glycine/D-amino acid oxidase-like deaminating enzyme